MLRSCKNIYSNNIQILSDSKNIFGYLFSFLKSSFKIPKLFKFSKSDIIIVVLIL